METIQQKRERRNAKALELKALLDANPGNKWNEDNQKKYDAGIAEIEALDGEIAREQKVLDLSAEKAFKDMGGREIDLDVHNPENAKLRKLHDKWLRGGDNNLSAEDWSVIRNQMSTGTPAEGGYTVPETIAAEVIERLKDYSGMRKVANVISTTSGEKISFPTTDGTTEEGEIVPENASASDEDISFGTAPLETYKFSSKVFTVPIELIQDSRSDIDGLVNRRIRERLGRITNRMFSVGTGTSQPFGIAARASAGKVGASGQVTTVTFEDLVDLEHSVDVAYRESGNCAFMMNDKTVGELKKLKDLQGRPIFLPALSQGEPATLLGYPVVFNNHIPEMAANAKAIFFGDFKAYTIRDVMALTLFRFADSVYAKKGQVGFLAWMRSGGNLLDTAAVKYYQNAAS